MRHGGACGAVFSPDDCRYLYHVVLRSIKYKYYYYTHTHILILSYLINILHVRETCEVKADIRAYTDIHTDIYSSPVLDDDPRCDAIHVSCLQNELNVSAYKLMSTSRCYITIRYVYVDKSKSHIDILFSYIFLNHNLICVCSSINIYNINMIKIYDSFKFTHAASIMHVHKYTLEHPRTQTLHYGVVRADTPLSICREPSSMVPTHAPRASCDLPHSSDAASAHWLEESSGTTR